MAEEVKEIQKKDVNSRIDTIRNDSDCSLSLLPEDLQKLFNKDESKMIEEKIEESLIALAQYRVSKGTRLSYENSANEYKSGTMVMCEGLESFLIPAVEGVYPLGRLLERIDNQELFAECFLVDIDTLIEKWKDRLFPADPYLDNRLPTIIKPDFREEFRDEISLTEGAAIAVRICSHLIHLTINKEAKEPTFQKLIGKHLNLSDLFDSLHKAISFLVEAFQKGKNEDNPIGSAIWEKDTLCGGWSWGNRQGLPPILFFSSTVVEAFVELDYYLLRRATDKECQKEIKDFVEENKDLLSDFQFCIDMCSRWVKGSPLTNICDKMGHYEEPKITYLFHEEKGYDELNEEVDTSNKLNGITDNISPLLFYNNIYALTILLWTFSDKVVNGKSVETDQNVKSKIERAILQLVYNYEKVPSYRQVLTQLRYSFLLPGDELFTAENEEATKVRKYIDSAFLPYLTKLLILFSSYGVIDRNLIESLMNSLYSDLILNRCRQQKFSALWSKNVIEIFSTQRSIQALTFYCLYFKAREENLTRKYQAGKSSGSDNNEKASVLSFFKTVVSELEGEPLDESEVSEVIAEDESEPYEIPDNLRGYIRDIKGGAIPSTKGTDLYTTQTQVLKSGTKVIEAFKKKLLSKEVFEEIIEEFVDLAVNIDKESLSQLGEVMKKTNEIAEQNIFE